MNIRLGIETGSLSQTIRGIGTYTLALIKALEELKPTCFHPPNTTDTLFPHLSHHHFGTPPPVPFANSLAALTRGRCFDNMDLMIFPDPKILYGRKPKAPFLLTIHDLMPIKFPQFFPKKSGALMRYFLPRHLRDAAAIVAVSEQTKRDIESLFPFAQNKVHVIPCALPYDKKVEVSKSKDPFLLYIGSFEPRKNLVGIIEAFALLKQKGYPHTLVLAGKEEKQHKIPHGLIETLGLKNVISCAGYVSDEEKEALLQKCACLVWPSFYEGFGLPLLEAMRYGTPIVTSKIPVLEEVCGPAALYVDPRSAQDIAAGIEKILSEDHFFELGVQRAELFTLQRLKERYMSLLLCIHCIKRF